MSQRHLAVPEDDLKPYCKNGLGAKLQYPERLPEDDLKMHWVNQRIPPRYPPPRSPPALSVQLKEKRDAAILEKHKEGKSNKAIHKALSVHMATVAEVVGGTKMAEAQNCPPQSSTSTVPMASTEDRSETREDARS